MVEHPDEQGRSLAGRSNATSALTPHELRRRRLAALEGIFRVQHQQPQAAGTAVAIVPATHIGNDNPWNNEVLEDAMLDDEDRDLQAALAMSMHSPDDAQVVDRKEEDDDEEETPQSTMQRDEDPAENIEEWWRSGQDFDVSTFHSIMWDSVVTTDNDKSRWISQGIDLRQKMQVDVDSSTDGTMLSLVGSNHGPWGLTQAHGGPCGVLAAVQAELLRLLLFGGRHPLEYPTEPSENDESIQDPVITAELVQEALALAIAIIIARASLMPPAADESSVYDDQSAKRTCRIVLPTSSDDENGLTWEDLEPWSTNTIMTTPPALKVYTVSSPSLASNAPKRQKTKEPPPPHVPRDFRILHLAHAISKFLLTPASDGQRVPLDYFREAGGVLLLTMSLVASRGDTIISSDMDDPMGTKLTSQFGHCGQELMNLLLTGQAVSNVFDNTLTPSGALTCRGVQSRPAIGYLSQLEAMRYCEVGGYYKSPQFPIWVVGSTSHFTVLFGDSQCLKESKSDVLLEKCRRAFKSIEGGEENGYIATASLGKVFELLELDVGGESAVETLGASIEVSGAGIILWDDFWKAASRLLTGASFVSVLQGTDDDSTSSDQPPDLGPPESPLLLAEDIMNQDDDKKPAAMASPFMESDEEMARRLAAEWGAAAENSPVLAVTSTPAVAAAAAVARPPSPMGMDPLVTSDEELARKLYEEWNHQAAASPSGTSVTALAGSPRTLAPMIESATPLAPPKHVSFEGIANGKANTEDTKMPAAAEAARKLDFESYGNSFRMYHYNGLRGGTLTPFKVTRLSPEEAVGASVALSNSTHSSAGTGDKGPGSVSGDLEDVVRTKWPSCVIDWLGKQPPFID